MTNTYMIGWDALLYKEMHPVQICEKLFWYNPPNGKKIHDFHQKMRRYFYENGIEFLLPGNKIVVTEQKKVFVESSLDTRFAAGSYSWETLLHMNIEVRSEKKMENGEILALILLSMAQPIRTIREMELVKEGVICGKPHSSSGQ